MKGAYLSMSGRDAIFSATSSDSGNAGTVTFDSGEWYAGKIVIDIEGEVAYDKIAFEGKFKDFLEECVKNEKFNKLAPRTKITEDRYEGFEMVSRFFAYFDNYEDSFKGYTGNVTKYIDDYVEKQNQLVEKNDDIIESCRVRFSNMLDYAEKIL